MGKKSARKNAAAAAAAAAAATTAPATKRTDEPGAVVQPLTTVSASGGHPAALPVLKRIELRQLVDALLQMTLIKTVTPADQWQQYVDMQTLLSRIRSLEADIRWRPQQQPQPQQPQRAQHVAAFKRWAHENGAHFEGVDIAEFSGYELGLVATRPIRRGALFVTVPRRLIMTPESVPTPAGTPGLRRLMRRLPMIEQMPSVRLAFGVLVERLLDEKSFWRPYLNVLPERYATVLAYTVNEMQELRGSSALPEALRQCRSIARQYACVRKLLHGDETAAAPGGGDNEADGDDTDGLLELLRDKFTYELYCWAVSTVMTRQNSMPADIDQQDDDIDGAVAPAPATKDNGDEELRPALIPLWDMANHTDGEVTNVYSLAERRVECAALRDFAKGDQIFIYYGDRRNSKFLIHNGFVYPDNRNDSVAIRLGLSPSDPLYAQRLAVLQRLRIDPAATELLVVPAPHHLSGEMLAFVRVFNMNAAQLEHWLGADRNATDLKCVDCALDTELEQRTWTFMKVRFQLLLRAFPSALADDEAAVEAHRRGQHKMGFVRAMVVQYRVLEKRLLGAALEYVSQRTKQ